MKFHHFIFPVFYLFLVVILYGCASNEIGESKDVLQETIYQQYKISFREGDENAIVYAQFRFAGSNGTTLVLSSPGRLQFDGVAMEVDSSEYEGAFYKKTLAAKNFYGEHHICFTDINKRKYDNHFLLDSFKLMNVPAMALQNESLQIQFEPSMSGPDSYINLVAIETDSAFSVTYSGNDTNPFITIPAEEMKRQKGLQIKMMATLNKKMPLLQNTKEGGMLEIVYELKPVTLKLSK